MTKHFALISDSSLSVEKVQEMQEGPDPCPEGLEEVARVVEGLQDDHGHDLGGERGPADQDDLQPAAGGGEGVQAALQGAHHVPASTDPVLRDAGQQCQGGDHHQFIILMLILNLILILILILILMLILKVEIPAEKAQLVPFNGPTTSYSDEDEDDSEDEFDMPGLIWESQLSFCINNKHGFIMSDCSMRFKNESSKLLSLWLQFYSSPDGVLW